MSWSCNTVIPKGQPFGDTKEQIRAMQPVGNDDCPDERDKALRAAVATAISLIGGGSFGEAEEHAWYVTLSGHANPENRPREGWSKDCVTVSVSQK